MKWVNVREEERAEGDPRQSRGHSTSIPLLKLIFPVACARRQDILVFCEAPTKGQGLARGEINLIVGAWASVFCDRKIICVFVVGCARKPHEDRTQQRILDPKSHAFSCSTSIGHGENLTIMQSSFVWVFPLIF